VLRLTAPGLAALPWETLFDPDTGAHLCRKEPLVRHVRAPFTPDALAGSPPLRILGLVASPRGLSPLDVEAEQRRLSEALSPHVKAGWVELVWLTDASWVGLHAKLLEEVWHVLCPTLAARWASIVVCWDTPPLNGWSVRRGRSSTRTPQASNVARPVA